MKVCKACGNHMTDETKFCGKCGAKVADSPNEPAVSEQTGKAPAAASSPQPSPAIGVRVKSNRKSAGLVVLIILIAVAAGGYYLVIKDGGPFAALKDKIWPRTDNQISSSEPLPPAPVPTPAVTPETTPESTTAPVPGPQTKVKIKASATASDVRNGRPVGLSSSFRAGTTRVVHYVQFANATPGQTTLGSQFYKDGALIFKCSPKVMQYPAANYFCRMDQNLVAGNYEVRLSVDGIEKKALWFKVF
ncbi:MAG TPA: hypothetical protein VMB78_02580 [Dissulfurispiraceae bacterium]|nr:hypothetical protein [Dissulfurispiraceae bacterium]